jgi:Carboxypeptidase regulatory-like domain
MSIKGTRNALALWLFIAGQVVAAPSKAPDAIVVVLDCSANMGVDADGTDSMQRWQTAQRLLDNYLSDSARSTKNRVGLICVGHRLKWEGDAQRPDVVEQDDYLATSQGFATIGRLLPGDDVEKVIGMRPLGEQETAVLKPKLLALKPWGERPIHQALVQALSELAQEPASSNRRIVVLTSGANRAQRSRLSGSNDVVLSALQHALVPIHVIYVGDDAQAKETEDSLRPFTEFAGGDFRRADSQADLTVAEVVHSPMGNLKSARRPKGTAVEATAGQPTTQIITGKVVLNGNPVTSATVSLLGTKIAPVKLDDSGRFVIRNVPLGSYQIKVRAIAQNQVRETSETLTVGAEQVDVSLDVKEK